MFILRTTTVTECATANDFKILARLTINEWPEAKKKKIARKSSAFNNLSITLFITDI